MNQAQWNKAEFNESLVQLGVMRRVWYAMVYIMHLSLSQSDSKMSCMHTEHLAFWQIFVIYSDPKIIIVVATVALEPYIDPQIWPIYWLDHYISIQNIAWKQHRLIGKMCLWWDFCKEWHYKFL